MVSWWTRRLRLVDLLMSHGGSGRHLDGVLHVGRYPCLRQDEHVEATVSDDVLDQGGLLAG